MTAPEPAPDWESIARYLSGESDAAETASVRAWLDSNPRDAQLLNRLADVATDSVSPAAADVDVEAALARVHARMRDAEGSRLTLIAGAAPSRRFVVAGALLAAAAVAAIVVTLRPSASRGQASPGRVLATTVGQRDSVILADGSRIILGPQSRVAVAADYGTSSRTVELTGDAYFDVRHDAARPFSVRVDGAVIEDIGTTFTVESDAGGLTSVAVVAGSVRLRASGTAGADGLTLGAGDRGTLGADGRGSAERHSVTDEDLAWTTGRLVFRDAPLSRVAAEIQRWYGITLHSGDSALFDRHITTSFAGESPDQVLKILALTLNMQIERQGDSATVTAIRGAPISR